MTVVTFLSFLAKEFGVKFSHFEIYSQKYPRLALNYKPDSKLLADKLVYYHNLFSENCMELTRRCDMFILKRILGVNFL